MTYTIHQATCPLICPVRAPVNECVWPFDFLLAKELLKTEDFLYIRQRPQHASFHTHSASVCNDLAILEANEIVLFFHVCVCVCSLLLFSSQRPLKDILFLDLWCPAHIH